MQMIVPTKSLRNIQVEIFTQFYASSYQILTWEILSHKKRRIKRRGYASPPLLKRWGEELSAIFNQLPDML